MRIIKLETLTNKRHLNDIEKILRELVKIEYYKRSVINC